MNDGPSFESEIWQHYQQTHPGEVQALGIDLFNGTSAAVTSFRDAIGATFPMLLNGSSATGGNVSSLYGDRDNYVVISKQGIVRYHAQLVWPYGGRYRRDEIRGAIDSLVTPTVSVGAGGREGPELHVGPNPSRERTAISLSLAAPARRAQVAIFDVSGRRVAVLYDGPLAAGPLALEWDARARGAAAPPGMYRVVAELDGRRLERRLVRLR